MYWEKLRQEEWEMGERDGDEKGEERKERTEGRMLFDGDGERREGKRFCAVSVGCATHSLISPQNLSMYE